MTARRHMRVLALSREQHEARVVETAKALNEALADAHADGFQPWITVMVGDVEPRPYTYVGRVAVLAGRAP